MKAPAFRALEPRDLEAVCAIEAASFTPPWSRALFEEELKRPELCHWLVSEDAALPGGIAAYGGFWRAVDEAHFTNLAVHPEARGRGLGRALLRALLDKARAAGCLRATLEVRPSNTAAVRLYQSEGFRAAALRPRYYSDGEDALLLWHDALRATPDGTDG